ncbi:phenylacetate--CoA ligase family protein [Streptomyces sp. SCL15-4]|uniref:phenylacetate--CoA ligase family protein n=1 Tax=Streptomyces sp. SCL15-4 TaxID=2967221 RepID=UPI002966E4B6|nr:phenylacetate--CoA ligase family protein [Streptomyces sp. SCL15-4]
MNRPRHYPTDLLITVAEAQAALVREQGTGLAALLRDAPFAFPRELFDADELAAGLDELCGGLAQYPWQPVADSNDVYELSPVGTIVVDDTRPDAVPRALLLGWALGNDVVVRTERRAFWRELTGLLRAIGPLLPDARIVPSGTPAAGVLVDVPEPTPLPPDAHAASGNTSVWREDGRADWVRSLRRRTYLRGIPLARARGREDAAATERLDAKLRYLAHHARRSAPYRALPPLRGIADLPRLDTSTPPASEAPYRAAPAAAPRRPVHPCTDEAALAREAIPMLHAMGLREGDRLINTVPGGDPNGALAAALTECVRTPAEYRTRARPVAAGPLAALVRGIGATALLGTPALLMPLLRAAHVHDPGLRLEKVLFLGTCADPADEAWLRTHLGAPAVSGVLTAADGTLLGYRCTEMSGPLYHVNDDLSHLEAVDQAGVPVPDGRPGHLLVTGMQTFERPRIRHRVGGRGRVFRHACGCGVTGRVLEYHGRADGMIRAGGRAAVPRGDVCGTGDGTARPLTGLRMASA